MHERFSIWSAHGLPQSLRLWVKQINIFETKFLRDNFKRHSTDDICSVAIDRLGPL